MIRRIVFSALTIVAFNSQGKDLICRGESVEKKDLGRSKRTLVFTYDAKTLQASYPAGMLQEKATGTLHANPGEYVGTLKTEYGEEFMVVLDRYSGEFTAMPDIRKSQFMFDFRGTCEEAAPKF